MCMVNKLSNSTCPNVVKLDLKIISINSFVRPKLFEINLINLSQAWQV